MPRKEGQAADKLEVWKTCVEIVSSTVTVVGAVIAALWALHEYNGDAARGRIQATLDFRKQYDSDPVFLARKVVDSGWLSVDAESEAIRSSNDWAGYANLVAQLAAQPDFRLSLTTIIGFYDELFVCVRDQICDLRTTLDLFGKDALTYRNADYPFLQTERARRNYPAFACGVDEMGKLYAARARAKDAAEPEILPRNSCS